MSSRDNHSPQALLGDQRSLSAEARKEIRALMGARPREFLMYALGAWATIGITIAIAVHVSSMWMDLLAIVIIGTRLNILALLVHEQTHSVGIKGRYGDVIANLLSAYPLGVTVEDYARVHLLHHQFFLTEGDPDFHRKSGSDWIFPMPYSSLLKLFLKDLTGLSYIELLKGKRIEHKSVHRRRHPSPKWLRPAFYALGALLLTYTGGWHSFLVYWILPLVFVFPAVVRVSAICEHVYDLPPGAGVTQSSPIILLRWWEKMLLPDLNFKLHAYHHFFPGIAFCHLPKVHEIFRRERLVDESAVFHGFFSYFKYLQSTPSRPRTSSVSTLFEHSSERELNH